MEDKTFYSIIMILVGLAAILLASVVRNNNGHKGGVDYTISLYLIGVFSLVAGIISLFS